MAMAKKDMNMTETETRPIVVRENVIIGISLTFLVAIVIGVFKVGVYFADFNQSQKQTTAQVTELTLQVVKLRAELIDYVDARVGTATAQRYTSAHDEIRTMLFKQRLARAAVVGDVADAYPDFAELEKEVRKYSITGAISEKKAGPK